MQAPDLKDLFVWTHFGLLEMKQLPVSDVVVDTATYGALIKAGEEKSVCAYCAYCADCTLLRPQ